jgi:N-acetylglucosamine-6-phosphate deacetylase
MITTLRVEQLFDGSEIHCHRPISFEDGKTINLDTVNGAKEINISDMLATGFINIQVSGGGG